MAAEHASAAPLTVTERCKLFSHCTFTSHVLDAGDAALGADLQETIAETQNDEEEQALPGSQVGLAFAFVNADFSCAVSLQPSQCCPSVPSVRDKAQPLLLSLLWIDRFPPVLAAIQGWPDKVCITLFVQARRHASETMQFAARLHTPSSVMGFNALHLKQNKPEMPVQERGLPLMFGHSVKIWGLHTSMCSCINVCSS